MPLPRGRLFQVFFLGRYPDSVPCIVTLVAPDIQCEFFERDIIVPLFVVGQYVEKDLVFLLLFR